MKKSAKRKKLNLSMETVYKFQRDVLIAAGDPWQTYSHLSFCPTCHTQEAGCTGVCL